MARRGGPMMPRASNDRSPLMGDAPFDAPAGIETLGQRTALAAETVSQRQFYGEYHGHPPAALAEVVQSLRAQGKTLIWLAGDSSLDNKYWFHDTAPALNGYENILRPATMKQDVCYWVNKAAAERAAAGGSAAGPPLACVNTAIEATSLNDRACSKLWAQDELIREHIGPDDILVVSVGGNDVALQPLCCTVCSMFALVYIPLPACVVQNCAIACPPNLGNVCDLGCLGCGVPNCISSVLCGCPLGFPYMVDMFKNRVGNYVRRLVSETKPKKVVICMIYYLDEKATGGWADCALKCLCYDACPDRLQAGIEAAYYQGTSKIKIDGTEVSHILCTRFLLFWLTLPIAPTWKIRSCLFHCSKCSTARKQRTICRE